MADNKSAAQSEQCMQAWLNAGTLMRILASAGANPNTDFSRFMPRGKK